MDYAVAVATKGLSKVLLGGLVEGSLGGYFA